MTPLESVYKEVAEELGVDKKVVSKAYQLYWRCIKEKIKELPLLGTDLSEEEFNKLTTVFSISSIGKINCTYRRYKGVNKRFEIRKSIYGKYKESEAPVHEDCNNDEQV